MKGQVTIPKPVRDHLGLRPGDRVAFDVDAEGAVVLRKAVAEPEARGRSVHPASWDARTAGLTTDEIMAMTRGED